MNEYPDTIVKQIDFLHARIDEIEAVAVEAVEMIEQNSDHRDQDVDDDMSIVATDDTEHFCDRVYIEASPAFIFAQCDAQREIIRAALASYSGAPDGHDAQQWMREAVLASLAVAYCDHADYDPAWAEGL